MGSNLGRSVRTDPSYTRHLDDLFPTLGALEAAADAARSLVTSPGWPVLLDLLGAEIATIDRGLEGWQPEKTDADASRLAVDFAYKHGRRGGLKAPAAVLHALIDRAESRLEEQRAKHEGDAESSPEGE